MKLYVGAARWAGDFRGGLFWRSSEGGDWVEAPLPQPIQVQAVTTHPSRRQTIFAGTDRGLFRSDDAALTWRRLATPDGLQIWSVFIDPDDAGTLYAGTSPVGVLRSRDGGESWKAMAVTLPARLRMAFDCRVMRFARDPGNPRELYAALEVGGAMRSRDGGESWSDCAEDLVRLANEHPALRSRIQSDTETEGMLDAHALCLSPAAPGRLMLAVRMGLFDSVDGGAHWRSMRIEDFSPLTYSRDIVVSPHDPRVLYVCLSPASRSEEGRLYRSIDLGGSWTRLDHGIRAQATMMAVALEPGNARGIHCIARGGQVFSSSDDGATWSESMLPAPVRDIYALACA